LGHTLEWVLGPCSRRRSTTQAMLGHTLEWVLGPWGSSVADNSGALGRAREEERGELKR
jgi:hypothetical protein